MTEEQLAFITRVTELPRMIGPDQGPDRTLLYGYDCDRATWHIYQKDGELHRAVYRPSDLNSRTKPETTSTVRRSKRKPWCQTSASTPKPATLTSARS